ncbi:HNH endonuclease [Ramlibacter tataouinensis]|uniref:HNH endonuclease n=1 Tax=Ramlibacter tataouinensis TaxID=94132 RepID=A0A127JZU7_9BURK|nr:HNH endonuclease [Ramlibacter tataouinensis]
MALAGLGLGVVSATERSAAAVLAFKRANPCPSTGERRGACPGWQVDHVKPLCSGGEDTPANMQWLKVDDHRFKTLVDVRECRKMRKATAAPAKSP